MNNTSNNSQNHFPFTQRHEDLVDLWIEIRKRKYPLPLFLLLCLNLIFAPAVQAATSFTLSRSQSYAITLLGLVTIGLCIYLFVVIFQPEKF